MNYAATKIHRSSKAYPFNPLIIDYAELQLIPSTELIDHPSQATDPHEFCEHDILAYDRTHKVLQDNENASCLFDKHLSAELLPFIPELIAFIENEHANESFNCVDKPCECMMLLAEYYTNTDSGALNL